MSFLSRRKTHHTHSETTAESDDEPMFPPHPAVGGFASLRVQKSLERLSQTSHGGSTNSAGSDSGTKERGRKTEKVDKSSSIRHRLSSFTLLTSKKPQIHIPHSKTTRPSRTPFKDGGGIGFIANETSFTSMYRSRSPSPALSMTIRRPSGLGRRESQQNLPSIYSPTSPRSPTFPTSPTSPHSPYLNRSPTTVGRKPVKRRPVPTMDRLLSSSTPELSLNSRMKEDLPPWADDSSSSEDEEELSPSIPPPVSPTPLSRTVKKHTPPDISKLLPDELWGQIFSHASRDVSTTFALVSRHCLSISRRVLYGELNLRDTKDFPQVERCVSVLAQRREIGSLVQTFSCRTLPDISAPLSTVTFAIAFSNMDQLQSLTLPSFHSHLLHHATFRLKWITFLCDSITDETCREMLTWLETQPNITSFSLPNLCLKTFNVVAAPFPGGNDSLNATTGLLPSTPNRDSGYGSSTPPSPSPSSSDLPSTLENTQPLHTIPYTFLPNLTHFHGPVVLATAICPGRPLQSVSLHVHSTLYDGLRPSAIMKALARSSSFVKKLSIIVSSKHRVDARTLERVLMSAGAELGKCLEVLEVEWILEDEILYKQILAVLPRFQALRTLHLFRRSPPPPPSSPPPSLPLPHTSLSPPPSPSSIIANSKVFSYSPPGTPTTNISNNNNINNHNTSLGLGVGHGISSSGSTSRNGSRSRSNTSKTSRSSKRISLDVPLSRAHERSHLVNWNKHCSTLRNIIFLSGAEWNIGHVCEDLDGMGSMTTTTTFSFRRTRAYSLKM
ncbi:hypothetical protein C8Q75DRAFT_757651 [Abortiporus biennis]|nr:hypothetical protein C8Q75DRAFT_757651 [Abortiporus biennis]